MTTAIMIATVVHNNSSGSGGEPNTSVRVRSSESLMEIQRSPVPGQQRGGLSSPNSNWQYNTPIAAAAAAAAAATVAAAHLLSNHTVTMATDSGQDSGILSGSDFRSSLSPDSEASISSQYSSNGSAYYQHAIEISGDMAAMPSTSSSSAASTSNHHYHHSPPWRDHHLHRSISADSGHHSQPSNEDYLQRSHTANSPSTSTDSSPNGEHQIDASALGDMTSSPPSENGSGDYDDPNNDINTPRISSHGKMKTFKCKQCSFVAVIKTKYWEHCATHIPADKTLKCPHCPFVTAYKHHIEYHLANHSGKKPFACSMCAYRCVNKSMLSSHMKSHSRIYQYHCANCQYVTKYCHSFKQHLRKYNHNPDILLNPDGTPSENGKLDVYGTRRGPRMKPINVDDISENCKQVAAAAAHSAATVTSEPATAHQTINIQRQCDNMEPIVVPTESMHPLQPPSGHLAAPMAFLPPPYMYPDPQLLQCFQELLIQQQQVNYQRLRPRDARFRPITRLTVDNIPTEESGPLDLSRGSRTGHSRQQNANDLNGHLATAKSSAPFSSQSSSATSLKNRRRKGKAFKLRPPQQLQYHQQPEPAVGVSSDEPPPPPLTSSPNNITTFIPSPFLSFASPPTHTDTTTTNITSSGMMQNCVYECRHCSMLFGDSVLYSMHMGFHGGQDRPFMCRMCNADCEDKVKFFIHLTTTSH